MKKSVVIAYYNGKKYIKEQVDSILVQLEEEDELIISVDDWNDGSEEFLKELERKEHRVRIVEGPHLGVVKNFENGLKQCSGDIIFIADQDDVWESDKIHKVCHAFKDPRVVAVVHNARIVDGDLKNVGATTFEWRDSRSGFWKNIKKNSYIGCCMAVKKGVLKSILPIPDSIWIHDQWIGLLCEQLGRVEFLDEPLMMYRRHGDNVTELTHGSVISMLGKRYHMILEVNRRVREWKKEDAEVKAIL